MNVASDAIVIGGGLHGLSAALQLARRGTRVTLLERSRIGRHASGASAAGVRTLGRAREELPVSLAAMEMWHAMEELVGDDCGFQPNGQLLVAENEAELTDLRSEVDSLRQEGFTHEQMLDAATLHDLVPSIAPHCVGAIFAARDGAADPHRTLAAFLKAVVEAGVTVYERTGISELRRSNGVWLASSEACVFEAPLLVNAAGAWAGQIAAMAGDPIPIETKASMMLVTERVAPFLRPTVGAAGRKLSFKQTAQGTLLIGGGQQGRADLKNESTEIDTRALAKSAAAAVAFFPSIRGVRIVRSWAGLEAKTEDSIAIAGLSPSAPGLVHLFGFSGHGFQLVPALGIVAAELLLDGRTKFDISGLAPERLLKSTDSMRKSKSAVPIPNRACLNDAE